eukprot:Nitzschia sp. Nitz4//scaffold26_size159584//63565//64635//NITZ4_002487-RA/size159584-processed-gene-0.195-mRNA-1//1//CDS//3329545070//7365//frame0
MSTSSTRATTTNIIKQVAPLSFPWQTLDPFLFCVHHDDHFPAGKEDMSPTTGVAGRNLGMDFSGKDGWSMYHGERVPGFPQHPHRGFETVTIVRNGYIDHSDSVGATARFGMGDVQWLTAGKGVVHSEMFPLVNTDKPNPTELFQIWLNLPAKHKFADPHFTMFWAPNIPVIQQTNEAGKQTTITVVAGSFEGQDHHDAPPPPPQSWASEPDSDLAIWTIKMEPGATTTLPPAAPGSNRCLYFFTGDSLQVGDQSLTPGKVVLLHADAPVPLATNLDNKEVAECLLLQGKPIGEPVAQQGPFVMNTQQELRQAYIDYQRTGFGGWPWEHDDPVHPREETRFAIHADGRKETAPPSK